MIDSTAIAAGVCLRELFPRAQFLGPGDFRVGSCTADSRQCRPGDLFAALPGTAYDGHAFAQRALDRGATALLVNRLLPLEAAQCIVPDTQAAFGQLCQALVDNPSRRMKVVGITGTNGKTTTAALLASVLATAGSRVGMLGTLGCYDSVEFAPSTLTTPRAAELAQWLARMEANRCSHAVMEVSSHALAQSRVAGIQFDVACVTNVRRDHLDFHGSLANYRQAKQRLLEHLAPGGLVVLNVDDPAAADFGRLVAGPALTVSMHREAEVTATLLERCISEQTFLLTAGNDSLAVRTQMVGDHHISNCLVATAVGLAYGIDLPTIVRGLEAVAAVPGRLERIECGQPFGVFVDYAHTPDALATVLDTLRPVTTGRLICVFGAGGNRDREKRPLMGRNVESRADLAIVTNDNPRSEHPAAIAEAIVAGFNAPGKVEVVLDRERAIRQALAIAAPGDCVLIAGKGHEEFQEVGSQLRPHDDREVVRRWLYNIEPDTAAQWDAGVRMALGNH